MNNVEIDANKVISELVDEAGQKSYQIAILRAQINHLQQELSSALEDLNRERKAKARKTPASQHGSD